MTARRGVLPALGVGLLIVLSACSDGGGSENSEQDEPDQPDPTAATTSPAAGEQWCQVFTPEDVEMAVPGQLDDATEVVLDDSTEGYECRVQVQPDGEEAETALSVAIVIDAAEEFEEVKGDYVDESDDPLNEDVSTGPGWLGESYFSPGTGVAMAPCGGPADTEMADTQVPYMIHLQAPMDGAEVDKDTLSAALTRTMISLDRSQGCSPAEVAPNPVTESTPPAP